MPAATDKAALLAVTAKEYADLTALLDKVPAALALVKDEDGTSIKDVVAHRAHWIGLFLGWQAQGMAGQAVAIPAPGYMWNDLKRYNADLRAAQAGVDWAAARTLLEAAASRLRAFLDSQTDATLYAGPMPGGGSAWTTGRWAEAAGPSHYRSAAKYIRARLRSG
ncbi:DfsB family protein [Pseudorhodobacter sp. E13]|uniref:ClbS/DfsB family four-helix bundle protein n=1 Tax=Pseudorhodobacter sp. E13 TaxID=2487931 RepID=UPI000F8DCE4A|nr:ClbS/DfsB family four-helix bundle protein [Pseudorhodobacter sp. E13]RUS59395.1 DfsB family protein [Pseudorhodobacter sp. E13]